MPLMKRSKGWEWGQSGKRFARNLQVTRQTTYASDYTGNVFCAKGKGHGVDPTCSPGASGGNVGKSSSGVTFSGRDDVLESVGHYAKREVSSLIERFPGVKQMLIDRPVNINLHSEGLVRGSIGFTAGVHRAGSDEINVGTMGKSVESNQLQFGKSHIDSSIPGVIRHELGHAVHLRLRSPDKEKWTEISADVGHVAESVSKRAAVNTNELFAESFNAFTHRGYKQGGLPESVELFMKRITKPASVSLTKNAFCPNGPGGGVDPHCSPGESMSMVSPSTRDIDFDEAQKRSHWERHKTLKNEFFPAVDKLLGVRGKTETAIGAWKDGAENSTVETFRGASHEAVRVSAAMKGLLAEQKAVLAFQNDPDGPDSMWKVRVESKDVKETHKKLLKLGIENHTLVDHGTYHEVYIFDEGGKISDKVQSFQMKGGHHVEGVRGSGEFIGSWESRDEGASKYREVLSAFASNGQAHRDAVKQFHQLRRRWLSERVENRSQDQTQTRAIVSRSGMVNALEMMLSDEQELIDNVFCKGKPGSGVDPTCKKAERALSPSETSTKQYIEMVAKMSPKSVESLVAQHGQLFKPPKDAIENRKLMAKYGVGDGVIKECFKNAGSCVLGYSEKLTYVEGVAMGSILPVHHAWLVTPDGQVIDPTWRGQVTSVQGHKVRTDPGTAYYGVPLKLEYIQKTISQTGVYGIFDWQNKELVEKGLAKKDVKRITVNAALTPNRRDPTRTTTLQRQFESAMVKRFKRFRRELYKLVVVEDAFGLKESQRIDPFNSVANVDYSSTQLEVTDPLALQRIAFLQEKLDPADVVELETKPHITVKYGLLTDDPKQVEELVARSGLIWVSLGNLSLFQSEEQDVLKMSVRSLGLENLNRLVSLLPNEDSHRVYSPHMTIAYLKPGTGAKYLQDPSFIEWQDFVFTKLTFSDKEEEHTELALNYEDSFGYTTNVSEVAEGRALNKPFRTPGGPKKFAVYTTGPNSKPVLVRFGDPNMEIKRDDPQRRKNFRARHSCDDDVGPKWKARYWSCKFWSKPSVSSLLNNSLLALNCGGKGGKPGPCPLQTADVREGGASFKTGQAVSFTYMRNLQKSPRPGAEDTFQQKIEPAGRYMTQTTQATVPGLETGQIQFKSPLVIPENTGEPEGRIYNETSWKMNLSQKYGGKTGKRLSQAIAKDGYDGIVTVKTYKGHTYTGEIVDISMFRPKLTINSLNPLRYDPLRTTNEQTLNTRWKFSTLFEKLTAFKVWLGTKLLPILTDESVTEDDWWRKYVFDGFQKGQGRVWDDFQGKGIPNWTKAEGALYAGSKKSFLESAFNNPESVDKVELLASRVFTELKGVTEAMSQNLTRALTDGLTQGKNPRNIASDIVQQVDGIGIKRARVIARTEIIRAHSEGQLDAMEKLGVKQIGVAVEWSATEDERVCPACADLQGIVLSLDEAKGLIPRHPNCRCAFIPANVGEDDSEQIRSVEKIKKAMARSARRGMSKKSIKAKKRSAWVGGSRKISSVRPKSILKRPTNNSRHSHGWPSWYIGKPVVNVFCATGEGGGVDPSCSLKKGTDDGNKSGISGVSKQKSEGPINPGILGTGRIGVDGRRVHPGTLPEASSREAVNRVAENYVAQYGDALGISRKKPPTEPVLLDTARSKRIGDVYENLPETTLHEPTTRKAYEKLARETTLQYQHIVKSGMKIDFMTDDPYPSSSAMMKDVAENKHLKVFLTSPESFGSKEVTHNHPLLEGTGIYHNGHELVVNDLFRAVHDYFGHASEGNEFGPVGEERAWAKHSRMFSEEAKQAMTSETRGQNSWVNFGPHMWDHDGWKGDKRHPHYVAPKDRHYAVQKVAILPDSFVANIFCATGEGGGVDATCSPSKKGSPDHNEIINAIADVRDRWKYHGNMQLLQEEGYEFERGGLKWKAVGDCQLDNGSIRIFLNSFWRDIDTAKHVTAHELMHGTFEKVYQKFVAEQKQIGDSPNPEEFIGPSGAIRHQYDKPQYWPTYARLERLLDAKQSKLIKEDGVTEYSKAYWKDYEAGKVPFHIALHETLAEIAGIHETTGVIQGSKPYRDLYKAVRDEYRVLTDQQSKRKGPGIVTNANNFIPHELYFDKKFRPVPIAKAIYVRWWDADGNHGWGSRVSQTTNAGENCGISAGGFQPGNTCAKGGSGKLDSHPLMKIASEGSREAISLVLANAPAGLIKKALPNVTKIQSYTSPLELSRAVFFKDSEETSGLFAGVSGFLGFVTDNKKPRKGAKTLAHEIGHAANIISKGEDGRHLTFHSDSKAWVDAWQKEIKDTGKLSEYATTDPYEGWAEFARLVVFSPRHLDKFPRCKKIWGDHGLLR